MTPIDGAPKAGELLAGKYILLERIGEGGMGIVFLAEQPSLGRKVAIKLLQPALVTRDALVRQFHTEAVAACRVQHPGAIAVIDYGTTDEGAPFIVMEYVPGRLLSEVVEAEEIPVPRALKLIRQLLRTVKAAHAHGVVHADIKSDNVVIEHTPEGETVTLIDFGLARIEGRAEHTDPVPGTPGAVSGTPEYMAPELVRGEPPTPATDLYAVGVILYELLAGRRPFEGGSPADILSRQLEDAVIPPSLWRPGRGIPAGLDRIVLRALHKDPRARFASAGELASALASALTEVAREGQRLPRIPPRLGTGRTTSSPKTSTACSCRACGCCGCRATARGRARGSPPWRTRSPAPPAAT